MRGTHTQAAAHLTARVAVMRAAPHLQQWQAAAAAAAAGVQAVRLCNLPAVVRRVECGAADSHVTDVCLSWCAHGFHRQSTAMCLH
jgi:hypothetical protein